MTPDVLVVGASLGGVVAAERLASLGHRVLLAAEQPWLGGQLTAQGVPPDEHAHIDQGGASAGYLHFRAAMRAHYRALPGFADRGTSLAGYAGTNPGDGWVSRLCIEPAVAACWIEAWLAPRAPRLQVLRGVRPVSARRRGRTIESVMLAGSDGDRHEIRAGLVIDATDTGELLKLADLPYRLGKEARSEFGEPDAPELANPLDQQPVTHVAALRLTGAGERLAGLTDRSSRPLPAPPPDYEFWRERVVPGWAHRQFSLQAPGTRQGEPLTLPLFAPPPQLDWWRYRRIVSAAQWPAGKQQDVSLINWAQNDFALQPLLDGPVPNAEVEAAARALTLAFVHWLQTEAPRDDGRNGWPELQLASGVLGSADGLAQQVYVRESRRIVARETLTQNELRLTAGAGDAEPFHHPQAVAVAWYAMDIHPTCVSHHGLNARVRPFTLPLGSFIPEHVDNLLPACKNLGVTHLVNACTRVHPAEWAVGEVAGTLAAAALGERTAPAAIHDSATRTAALRNQLMRAGMPLVWLNTPSSDR